MFRNLYPLLAITTLFVLTACGGNTIAQKPLLLSSQEKPSFAIETVTQKVSDKTVPDDILTMVKDSTQNELRQAGYLNTDNPLYKVDVTLIEYRMRNTFNRVMWGVMAGSDKLRSVVVVKDRAGNTVGEATVGNFDATALAGGKGTVTAAHGKEIAYFLMGRKNDTNTKNGVNNGQ